MPPNDADDNVDTKARATAAAVPVTGGHAAAFDFVALMMGVVFALIWSSAFTSAKIALQDSPPLLLLTVRFALSGLIAIIIAKGLGQRWPTRPAQWGLLAVLGICQNSLYLGLFFIAMTSVPAGLASIIASTMPLLVAAAGSLIWRENLGWKGVLGLLLGFGGAVYIMQSRMGGDLDALGLTLCLIGVSALSIATLIVRHAELGCGLMMAVGLQMLVGSLTLAPFAFGFESFGQVTPTLPLLVSFLYLTLVPGVLATLLWFMLIRRIGAPRASAYHFLNPAFGVAIAWLVLAEPFGLADLVGVMVVAVGILIVQLSAMGAQRR